MKVVLENKEIIEVTKLPIGRYAEFLQIIRGLFSKVGVVSSLTGLTNEEFLSQLPTIIADNIPEVVKIIHVGTGMDEAKVEQLGLNECIDLVMAIFEVNKYAEVYEKIKKGLARLPKANTKQLTPPTGSPTQ